MNVFFIIGIIATVVVVVMAAAILMGRGDWMISGYNTTSKEDRAKYNLSRLRLLSGVSILVIILFVWVSNLLYLNDLIKASVLIAFAIIIAVLQYTWARK